MTNDIDEILRVLRLCGGNRKRAAERLGISLRTLFRRLRDVEQSDLDALTEELQHVGALDDRSARGQGIAVDATPAAILEALRRTDGDRAAAGAILGIGARMMARWSRKRLTQEHRDALLIELTAKEKAIPGWLLRRSG